MWESILATIRPSGVVYSSKPFISMRLDEKVLEDCRNTPSCITPSVASEEIVQAVKEAIGSELVRIMKMYGVIKMPFYPNFEGTLMRVEEVLDRLDNEGWPGYDCFLEGVNVYRGTGRFGREIYSICPVSSGEVVGGVEIQPVKKVA